MMCTTLKPALRILILIITLFYSVCTTAQKEKEIYKLSDYSKKEIKINQPGAAASGITLFNKVIVNDVRYDTSVICINSSNYFAVENISHSLEQYINQSLKFSENIDTGKQLIIFIKKLWLTNQFQLKETEEKRTADQGKANWLGGILCKMECYYKIDNYYFTAFRFDTSFSSDAKSIIADAPGLINICLNKIVSKIIFFQNKGLSKLAKKMTLSEVARYNDMRYELPVLQDSIHKKGVYITFSDFKENKPGYDTYEIQKGKFTDELYLQEAKGNKILLRNLWGYSDGKNLFIKSAENYFQLSRSGNTFYLKGVKSIQRYKNVKVGNVLTLGLIGGTVGSQNKKITFGLVYKPYQLDMDNGEIY